jgi:hypothetical protein
MMFAFFLGPKRLPLQETLLFTLLAAQIANTAQTPSTPGSSAAHWTTLTFAWATGFGLLVFALGFLVRRNLLAEIKRNLATRIFIYFSEAMAAVALSVIASYFDVFKKSTYIPTDQYRPDWHVFFWASIWASIASYYAVVKLFGIVTKESEESESKRLSADLEKERAAILSLSRQRDVLVKIMAFARQLVQRKIARLSTLINAPHLTPDKFVAQLDPRLQVQSIVKIIHEFFKRAEIPNARLRLALWMKDATSEPEGRLSVAYSWDGEAEGCFTNRSRDRMKLSTALGTQSEVVDCYHSHARNIKIIPDCGKAAEQRQFEFFYPEQRNKVQSMILYKHIFMEQSTGPVGVVLLLVSSVQNYFPEEKDQIKQFLDEMLTRIEMEWLVLEVTEDLEL